MPRNSGDLTAIDAALADHGERHPLAVTAFRALLGRLPSYRAVAVAALRRKAAFWDNAEERCREILHLCDGDRGRFAAAVFEWVKFSLEFLRKQQTFLQTGHYARNDYEEVQRELYDNDERMSKFYLVALMFSFLFSSNYVAFFDFFKRRLLPRVKDARAVCDIGCGHGVYLIQMLLAGRNAVGTGLDISPASLATAGRLLDCHRIPAARFQLQEGNLRERLPLEDGSQDAVTCFEVIEHLDDPGHAVREIRRLLRPGGSACLSTAIRMESVDHIHLFRHPAEVRALIAAAGFTVVEEDCIPLTAEDVEDPAARARLIEDPATPLGYIALLA